jgi:signal recognition particle GTPase
MPPHSLSSIFTGREELLDELAQLIDDDSSQYGNNVQKRFVVQGLGGAGKTEFCCKFAQVNRQR